MKKLGPLAVLAIGALGFISNAHATRFVLCTSMSSIPHVGNPNPSPQLVAGVAASELCVPTQSADGSWITPTPIPLYSGPEVDALMQPLIQKVNDLTNQVTTLKGEVETLRKDSVKKADIQEQVSEAVNRSILQNLSE